MQGHHLLSRWGQGLAWNLQAALVSGEGASSVGSWGEEVVPWFAHGPSLVFQSRPGSNAPCPLLLRG